MTAVERLKKMNGPEPYSTEDQIETTVLEAVREMGPIEIDPKKLREVSTSLNGAMSWVKSPQDRYFWANVFNNLNSLARALEAVAKERAKAPPPKAEPEKMYVGYDTMTVVGVAIARIEGTEEAEIDHGNPW